MKYQVMKSFLKSFKIAPPGYRIITNTLEWCWFRESDRYTPTVEWRWRWMACRASWVNYEKQKREALKNKWRYEDDPDLVFNNLIKENQ